MLISRVLKSWARQFVACMGSCLGGCVRPTPIIAVDEPSEGAKIQRESGEGPNSFDNFWFTSTNKMDNSTAPSQRSCSSISVSNRNADISGTTANSNNEFVNHDLNLWNEMRRQWVGDRPRNQPRQPREPVLSHGSSWTVSYESLLGSDRPYPQPVPLLEMVDFLVDVWEQEGLYD